MIQNEAVSPFADERKNAVRADVFLGNGTLLRAFSPHEVVEVSMVQEFHKNQTSVPRSEINISIDNRDKYFDISNPDSVIHSLVKECYCETYFSSVAFGDSETFVKKCRLFYDSFLENDSLFNLKFIDASSSKAFEKYITTAFDGSSSATTLKIVEGVKDKTNLNFEYEMTEDMAKKSFSKSLFMNDDQTDAMRNKEALHDIARRLGSSLKQTVYFMPDRDGVMVFRTQQTDVSATITKRHFAKCRIEQGNECLISKITDRGNILCQLGDIIEVVDEDKTFKTEVYRINYKFSKGILSSEWEGVIVQ